MKYIKLLEKVNDPIFSLQDLKKLRIKIFPYQLSDWSRKGYVIKLKNGLYALSSKTELLEAEHIAFNLYQPSYVSLGWALYKYGLIPDVAHNCTSVTARTTREFKNQFGFFSYRHVKKDLFFGYKIINRERLPYAIAEPEKALFDFLYLNINKINDQDDIDGLRLNELEIKKLKKDCIREYCNVASNKKLNYLFKLVFK